MVKILFRLETGAFFTPMEAKSITHREIHTLPRNSWRWQWIQDMTAAKASVLPQLRRIVIHEESFRKRCREGIFAFEGLAWSTTSSVQTQTMTLDIAIEAHLRIRSRYLS